MLHDVLAIVPSPVQITVDVATLFYNFMAAELVLPLCGCSLCFGENVVSFFRELCGTMKYHVSRNCLHSLSDLIFMSQSGRRSIAPRQCKQML